MKRLFMLVIISFLGFQANSQIKIGLDTTQKYNRRSPKLQKQKQEGYIGETEKNLELKTNHNMPIKKTTGKIPNAAIDTTQRMPNMIKKKGK